MKTYVIYHADCPDGFTSAWAFYKKLGSKATYLCAIYGEKPPEIEEGSEVYIADFSFSKDILLSMEKKAKKIVLLDHHLSARKDLEGLSFATFDMNKSGARLSWEYCHGDKKIPKIVDYVMDRDLWLFKLPYSKEAHAYLSTFNWDFSEWDKLANVFEENFDEIIKMGGILLKNDQMEVKTICSFSKEILFDNERVPCVNTPVLNSEVGHHLLQLYPNAKFSMSWFLDKNGKVKISLRSRGDYDVSFVAKKYGGGGHKAAAGCSVDNIPNYFL